MAADEADAVSDDQEESNPKSRINQHNNDIGRQVNEYILYKIFGL